MLETLVGKYGHPSLFSMVAAAWLFPWHGIGNVSQGLTPSAVSLFLVMKRLGI